MTPTGLTWRRRFDGRAHRLGIALIGLVVLGLWSVLAGSSTSVSRASSTDTDTDIALYNAIIERMDRGESYYEAVADEQPARHYPVSPVVAVREPTLAWFVSTVGRPAAVGVMLALGIAALAVSVRTFELTESSRSAWIATTALAAAGIGTLCRPGVVGQHEIWAGLLIYLAFMLRGYGRVLLPVLLLLLAAMIRELAAPAMVVMLALAVRDRRNREATLWLVACGVFSMFYAWHFWQYSQMTGPDGPAGPGWLELGGWPFVVDAFGGSSLLTLLPHAALAFAVPLAFLGWLSRSGDLFDRVTLLLVGYAALLCVAGRPDNFYWGMLSVALLLPGIAFGIGTISRSITAVVRERSST